MSSSSDADQARTDARNTSSGRFLQSPDGVTPQGSARAYTDEEAVWNLKKWTLAGKESQTSLINYCKGGRPFINLITMLVVPLSYCPAHSLTRQ